MGSLGVDPRSVGVEVAEGLCALGGGNHFGWRPPLWGGGPCPLYHYALAFALQLRKSTENFSQGSRAAWGLLVAPTWLTFEGLPRLACLDVRSPRFPRWLQSPLDRPGAFRVAVLRGSPHQLTSSRNSRSMLWCSRRRTESPNPREFACYQRTKVCW
jgi:hypothetical protein